MILVARAAIAHVAVRALLGRWLGFGLGVSERGREWRCRVHTYKSAFKNFLSKEQQGGGS